MQRLLRILMNFLSREYVLPKDMQRLCNADESFVIYICIEHMLMHVVILGGCVAQGNAAPLQHGRILPTIELGGVCVFMCMHVCMFCVFVFVLMRVCVHDFW